MPTRRALLVPGRGYDTRAPLFAYGGEALRRMGFATDEVRWQVPAELPLGRAAAWVREQVMPALGESVELIVGKSMGTFAVSLAEQRRLRGIWLTPLLTYSEIVEILGRTETPFLLIGGTADRLWNGEIARRLTRHVLEIPEADHSLLLPGPMARSAAVLGQVCTAIEEFVVSG